MALSLKDADKIIELEKTSSGKVMVGYMRRYASAFIDAVKEIGTLGQVQYARVRDIVGPNSDFVGQSGTFPKVFSDFRAEDLKELAGKTGELLEQGLTSELGISVTADTANQWRNLGSLGSHDLSAMREALGMPSGVLGASLCTAKGPQFWRYVVFILFVGSRLISVVRCSNIPLLLCLMSLALMRFLALMPRLRSLVAGRLSRSALIRLMLRVCRLLCIFVRSWRMGRSGSLWFGRHMRMRTLWK